MNDNNNRLGRSCDRLSEIAEIARQNLVTQNIYQNVEGKTYTSRHPNATQVQGGVDDRTNIKGKGTGEYLDTRGGGGYYDINGRPELGGGGRNALLSKNIYTADNPYDCFIF